jgi:hypothetical protein
MAITRVDLIIDTPQYFAEMEGRNELRPSISAKYS